MPRRRPSPTRRAPRTLVVSLAATVTMAMTSAGCGDDDDEVVSEEATTTTTGEGAGTSTSTTTSAVATTSTSVTTTTTAPFDGGTARVELPGPAATDGVVHHTELDVGSSGGEERVTFGFDGGPPGVVVEYVDGPVLESGSGFEVEVEGAAVLTVRFEPAAGARVEGEVVTRTYTGPQRVAGTGGTVAELVRTGDFEAQYEWAIGVASEVPFRVETSDADDTVTVVVPAG